MTKGNFLEVLSLVASHDEIVNDRLTCGPQSATYTYPEVQNTLLQIMGGMVQSILCSRIQEAGMFSLLVDESKDRAKKKQLTIVLRCVDPKECDIHEYSLTFVEAASLDAEGLTQYIVDTLRKHQLDLACIISQGYDGA